VRAIEKHPGCSVVTRAAVERINVAGGKACGVALQGGRQAKASAAVVSNCDPKVLRGLVPRGATEGPELDAWLDGLVRDWVGGPPANAVAAPSPGGVAAGDAPGTVEVGDGALRSFIHLHAGIDATGLPAAPSADFPAQWAVVRDWRAAGDGGVRGAGAFCGVEAPRNVVLVSVPSLLDPALAPPGKHVLHAYVPATEPWAPWAHLDRKSDEYAAKKVHARVESKCCSFFFFFLFFDPCSGRSRRFFMGGRGGVHSERESACRGRDRASGHAAHPPAVLAAEQRQLRPSCCRGLGKDAAGPQVAAARPLALRGLHFSR
jgi:hypothetical protein